MECWGYEDFLDRLRAGLVDFGVRRVWRFSGRRVVRAARSEAGRRLGGAARVLRPFLMRMRMRLPFWVRGLTTEGLQRWLQPFG